MVSQVKISATVSSAICTELWMTREINTFVDDNLKRGDEISSALLTTIEESRISIIIFSESSVSSRWCLQVLMKFLECKNRETNKQIVIPVFYRVSQSDVRYQTGRLAVAFAKHEKRFKKNLEQVRRWKYALTEAACLSGWPSSAYKSDASFIQHIVEALFNDSLPTKKCCSSNVATGLMSAEFKARKRQCVVDDFSYTWDGVGEKSISNDDDDDGIVFFYNGVCRRISKYWRKGDLLGRGSFGAVYNAINEDGFIFAVKEVSLLDQSP